MPPDTTSAPPPPRFRTVIFDCDSTLSAIEGIDELATGQREAIAALTDSAMRGEVPLEAVYGQRLALIRPSREAIEALGAQYIATAVPGARETVATLQAHGVRVCIISGGIHQAILPFAEWLGVPIGDVVGVKVYFDQNGEYAGYDTDSPLTRSEGKCAMANVCRLAAPSPILMVGDGVTDLEARPSVDMFVAYAGVVDREAVTSQADAVVRGSMVEVLEIVLSPES